MRLRFTIRDLLWLATTPLMGCFLKAGRFVNRNHGRRMNMHGRLMPASIMAVLAIASVACLSAAEVQVPRWQPHDFAFSLDAPQGNPFQLSFSAEVLGPKGISFSVPGFYDGDGTWKVRVSPTAEGAWTLMTQSAVAALDKQHRSFECVSSSSANVHGALRVDAEHPHQFIYEDGSRFFPMGYECDWLWASTPMIQS